MRRDELHHPVTSAFMHSGGDIKVVKTAQQIAMVMLAILMSVSCLTVPALSDEQIDPVRLEGVWFTCEFARRQSPPRDNCMMLDDEGFSVSDGRVRYLRMQGSDETDCKGSKKGQCFSSQLPEITVTDRPVGKIRLEDNLLFVRYMACTQKFHLTDHKDYVAVIPDEKKCFWATKRHFYVTLYKGKVTITK